MRITLIILTVAVAGMGAGFAAETASAPATRAASTQATTQVVASWASPKEAYMTFARAYVMRDGLTLSKSVAWEDPSDEARAKLLTPPTTSTIELYALLAQQFPEDKWCATMLATTTASAEKEKAGAADVMAKTEALVAKAEVVMDGDAATLKMRPIINGGNLEAVKLKRIGGAWRVLPEVIGMPYAPLNAEMRAAMDASARMQARAEELNREAQAAFVKELQAKKYATAKDAQAALLKIWKDTTDKLMAEERASNGAP